MAAKKKTKKKAAQAVSPELLASVETILRKHAKEIAATVLYKSMDYDDREEIEAEFTESGSDIDPSTALGDISLSDQERDALLAFCLGPREPKLISFSVRSLSDLRKIRENVEDSCLSEATKEAVLAALDA